MMFAYLLCHMIGVTSTVTNPILYAMLNCNFQTEFQIAAGRIRGFILFFFTSHWGGDSRSTVELDDIEPTIRTTQHSNNITQEISTPNNTNTEELSVSVIGTYPTTGLKVGGGVVGGP